MKPWLSYLLPSTGYNITWQWSQYSHISYLPLFTHVTIKPAKVSRVLSFSSHNIMWWQSQHCHRYYSLQIGIENYCYWELTSFQGGAGATCNLTGDVILSCRTSRITQNTGQAFSCCCNPSTHTASKVHTAAVDILHVTVCDKLT